MDTTDQNQQSSNNNQDGLAPNSELAKFFPNLVNTQPPPSSPPPTAHSTIFNYPNYHEAAPPPSNFTNPAYVYGGAPPPPPFFSNGVPSPYGYGGGAPSPSPNSPTPYNVPLPVSPFAHLAAPTNILTPPGTPYTTTHSSRPLSAGGEETISINTTNANITTTSTTNLIAPTTPQQEVTTTSTTTATTSATTSVNRQQHSNRPGIRIKGKRIVYKLDNTEGAQRKQLESSPITIFTSDPTYSLGNSIAVNNNYVSFWTLHRHSSARALLRGHSGGVVDVSFFTRWSMLEEGKASSEAEDAGTDLLASTGKDGNIFIWKLTNPSPETISYQ